MRWCSILFIFAAPNRDVNSVGLECHLDRVEVTGSSPVHPTIAGHVPAFFLSCQHQTYRFMKKSLLVAFTLLFTGAVLSQDTLTYWKTETVTGLSFSQVSLSNWAAGGENSISGNAYLKLNSQYKRNKTDFETQLSLAYGLTRQSSAGIRKNDDKIEWDAKYGYTLTKTFNLSTLFSFRTQFTEGFDYKNNDSVPISTFLAPAYLMLGEGLDYKPLPCLSLYLSPATAKLTVVTDQKLADGGAYGVETAQYDDAGNKIRDGKNLKLDLGATLRISFRKDIMQNINLAWNFQLFSDYLKNPQNMDVNSELAILMKINDYINTNLTVNLLYDDDIRITDKDGKTGPRTQFKEVFGLGFTYKF